MCEATTAQVAIMAASAAMAAKQSKDAQQRERKRIAMEEDRNDERAKRLVQQTSQDAEQYSADVRDQRYQEARERAAQSLTQQYEQARENLDLINQNSGYTGNVSSAYLAEKAKRAAKTKEKAYKMASLLGRMRAPQSLHQTEALNTRKIGMGMGSEQSAFGQQQSKN